MILYSTVGQGGEDHTTRGMDSDEGAPGTRPYYEPTFYVAYVRDPDGNKLACVYHKHKLYPAD